MSHPESPVRWKVVCSYDGTAFSGWQSQLGGQSIQDTIEARLAAIFKRDVRIHGSGRTDAGVHALGQVFHFDAAWRHDPAKLLISLRVGLPPTIQIKSVRRVPEAFHARFSAKGKVYAYHLHLGDADPFTRPFVWMLDRPRPPDFSAMERVADVLRGRHDFAAFAAFNGSERENTVRDLRRLEIRRKGRRVTLQFEADGFLYKMVRSLTGALVAAGEGKLTAERVAALLAGGVRMADVQTAPPQGLFLVKVRY
jgi:tRNA pseudouridine38-40 synthase